MRTLDLHLGPRLPALLGGVAAVSAVVLFSLVLPASAADTPGADERPSAPSVCGGPSAEPEQALHRVTAAPTVGSTGRIVHAGGVLSTPGPVAAARCDARPADLFGFAASPSRIPFRVLFCTWLN